MKRIISILLLVAMLITTLAGCGDDETTTTTTTTGEIVNTNTLPEGMTGEDLAKILLANERLNTHFLNTEGDIFENGSEVFRNLASETRDGMKDAVVSLGAVSLINHRLMPTFMAEQVIENEYNGKVTIIDDGDRVRYRWSEFVEYNNSLDAFLSTSAGIINTAEEGAEMIDYIKKNIRVVDKWIGDDYNEYLLHVEENSETLYRRTSYSVSICHRYKNEDGLDVYQMYMRQDESNLEQRMTYIPGLRFEFSILYNGMDNYFVADNSKGYWETYTVGDMSTHFNVSYFIMKDGLAYDAFYTPETGESTFLKVMSADKKTDIFNIQHLRNEFGFVDNEHKEFYICDIDIKLSGFDGVEYVEVDTTPDKVYVGNPDYEDRDFHNKYDVNIAPDTVGNMYYPLGNSIALHLTNGSSLKVGDTFLDGDISVEAVRVSGIGGHGYIGEFAIRIKGDTVEELFDNLKQFLDDNGLECRRDIDETIEGINIAYTEIPLITKYYKWNGVNVKDEEGIEAAIVIEKSRFADMNDLFLEVKNAQVIDIKDAATLELNMSFPSVALAQTTKASVSNMEFTIGEMSLTIEDTLLYVKDEPYHIAFALIDYEAGSGLIHLEASNNTSVKYADEEAFTVKTTGATFTAPVLNPGNYTVVAYIATSDGVRSSAYVPVEFDTVETEQVDEGEISYIASKGTKNECIISYVEIKEIHTGFVADKVLDYASFYEIVAELAFEYGIPSDALIEKAVTEELPEGSEEKPEITYVALTGEEEAVSSGVYRIKYAISNGVNSVESYVYVSFTEYIETVPAS